MLVLGDHIRCVAFTWGVGLDLGLNGGGGTWLAVEFQLHLIWSWCVCV